VVKDTLLPELKTGDVILELDHKSVDDWYQGLSPYLVGSPQSRSVQFCDWNSIFPPLMQLFLPDCFPIVFTDVHNRHHTLNVDRRTLEQKNQNAAVKACWLVPGKEIMYLKIPSFFTPKFEEDALALIQRYQSAKGMVIDLRGNAGGTTPRRLLSALMDRPYRWWSYSQNDCSNRISSTWTEPEPDAYQGRLSLLVDRATWSAGEDFAMPFLDNERGVLIGETTGGSTGQPFFDGFENGLRYSIGAMRVWFPDGAEFEGAGIVPDVNIEPQREDLYAGSDPVLEKALQVLRELDA
jgi:carboxyl-terminal processing protease